jgi:predicted alpha/beta superfamily hydrolase
VWIYLPPDYATSIRSYPVLYMHDGQNVFDDATSYAGEWGVDESLDGLHARGDRGVIVVAVDNGGTLRMDEYSPWRNERYGGGDGDAYVDFLVQTLKPYIDANFRTHADRLNTGIAGSSMGGLISLYAALKHPEVFGRAGVFSPALWFAREQIFELARAAHGPRPRLYFVSGAREGQMREAEGVYVRDQQRMVETLRDAGFVAGRDVVDIVHADGTHTEGFWRREFVPAYDWLFNRP